MRAPILAWGGRVNPPKLLLDENLSPAIAVTLAQEGVDVAHVRDRGLLNATDPIVFARAFQEDRIVVTSNVGDFEQLARGVQVHCGLVLLESGGLPRAEQLRLVRQAFALIVAEQSVGRDMVNRALRIWPDSAYVFEPVP